MAEKIEERFDAFCPCCGFYIFPRVDQIGETIICQNTGKEFVLEAPKQDSEIKAASAA